MPKHRTAPPNIRGVKHLDWGYQKVVARVEFEMDTIEADEYVKGC